ncbi:MAG: XisI protein [Acidobacteriota bacterium]|nr:XisI protein [Acidobacteriota bacterium]
MNRASRYREVIQQVIEESAATLSQGNDVAILPVRDPTHGQYLLISLGWYQRHHEHAIVFHAQLRGTRILIEMDGTEEGIANFLVEAGIEDTDIELAWARHRHAENQASIAA